MKALAYGIAKSSKVWCFLMLKGKNVLITGGTKGLGRELAIAFAGNGANVSINYNHDDRAAQDIRSLLAGYPAQLEIIKADAGTNEGMVHVCQESLRRLGHIDIFIHNAVKLIQCDLMSMQPEVWRSAFQVNLDPLMIGVQQLAPAMKERKWGKIFAISSMGSEFAVKDYAAIGVPKAAMEALIRYIAVELGPYGITANTISPGMLVTDALRTLNPNFEKRIQQVNATIPAIRPMEVADVAGAVVQLCAKEMDMINGEKIRIDGGQRIKAHVEGL